MKTIPILCFSLSIMFSVQAMSNASKKLMVSTGEWPPYLSSQKENHGCVASMLKDAFAIKGYTLEFTFLPWKRAYLEAKQGHYDLTAYWFDSKQKRQDFLFSKNNIRS